MVWYGSAMDDDPETQILFKPIYNEEEDQNDYLFLDFQVVYTRFPEIDSDGEEEDYSNLEKQTASRPHQFRKEWLFGGDKNYIEGVVYYILDLIDVPRYDNIVGRLTNEIWKLKECDAISWLRNIEIDIDVYVDKFPGEYEEMDLDVDVDVRPAVAPASGEAVEIHLETVVVETEGYCVICLDEIRVGSDVEAVRMPCLHEFHRSCGEEWLRNSGVCPVCRSVLPS